MENKEWEWIRDCIDKKESEDFKMYVDGFSDFLTLINKDYLYNKKFLSSYVDDFIKYNKIFSGKYKVLNNIIYILSKKKISLEDIIISLDGLVGTYDENNKSIDISVNRKGFNFYGVEKDKTVVEILYEDGKNVYQFEIDNKKNNIERELDKFIEIVKG